MTELTDEQKEDLEQWVGRRRKYIAAFVIWAFIIMPVLYFVLSRIFGFDNIYFLMFNKIMLLLILLALFFDIRYRKKCPNCGSAIGSELNMLINVPENCNKCKVKFK
ncbi:MAG: hypothetical protein AB1632_03265 [Nitrospirota bacterium]